MGRVWSAGADGYPGGRYAPPVVPGIVNSIFPKKNERIEVLGMVLLISLFIWRLIERSMRQHIEERN